jgi:hypothetical protein
MHQRCPVALALFGVLMLNQPSHASFNIIDDPDPEEPEYERASYRPEPVRPAPALYRQVAYTPAVYRPYADPIPDPIAQSPKTASVVEIGLADMDVPTIKQGGKNKPLPDALRAILPKGWHAKKGADVNGGMRISWDKGWDWVTTLNDVAREYHLSIVIDWNRQTVTVLKPEQEPEPRWIGQEDLEGEGHTSESSVGNARKHELYSVPQEARVQPSVRIAEPEKAIPITPTRSEFPKPAHYKPALHLISGQKMSESLNAWAKETGWNLIWEAKVDYPVSVDTTLSGSTEEILNQFGDALVHSRLPLRVDVYKLNKVIRVSN